MKTIISIIFFSLVSLTPVFSAAPEINCGSLPGCDKPAPQPGVDAPNVAINAIVEVVSLLIQYVAVLAVIVLMISGIMYLVSGGEEEKVKKAKTWIMWSLIGVVISISAWTIINVINNITITL